MGHLRNKNRGFSIIELLVALAIGSIIVAGIGSIMVVSSKSFASTSAEASMQSAAQIVMDHIQDVVIDANQKIEYSYTTADPYTSDADFTSVIKDSDITVPESDITYKRLAVYNYDQNDPERRRLYIIEWKHDKTASENSIINYSEFKIDEHLEPSGGQVGDTEKLADNVISFSCDLTDIPTKRIFFVEMNFKKAQKEYHAANNISLRNKISLSVDSISVNASVSMDTLEFNAEPGMELPLTLKKIRTTGNASNVVTFEFDKAVGEAGGPTSANTKIEGKTLKIAPDEQAEQIIIKAVPEKGDAKTFPVHINRVFWTDDLPGGKGHDTTEGISIISGSNEIEYDSSNVYSLAINSNPGYGIDRTKPARFKADFEVNPVTDTDCVSVNALGPASFKLSVDSNINKDTEITLKFTALHSLADSSVGGGMSVRTQSYPDGKPKGSDEGIYKKIVVKVTKEEPPEDPDIVFFRGMDTEVDFDDVARRLGEGDDFQKESRYRFIFWRPYQQRPAVQGGHNIDYPVKDDDPESTVWEKCPGNSAYTGGNSRADFSTKYSGWHQLQDGNNDALKGWEFNCISPNFDTQIQYFMVVEDIHGNVRFSKKYGITQIYGFRGGITRSDVTDSTEVKKSIYLGTYHELDGTDPGWFEKNKYKVWQTKPCFKNLASVKLPGGADGNLKMYLRVSKKLEEKTGDRYDWVENSAASGGDTHTYGEYSFNMTKYLDYKDNLWINNVKSLLNVSDDPYYMWPEFEYTEAKHENTGDAGEKLEPNRLDAAMKFNVKKGNIKIGSTEYFVPYPKFSKEGVIIDAHKDFYGNSITTWQDGYYKSVGVKSIKKEYGTDDYDCAVCFKNDTYWLKIYGAGEYEFDVSKEEWIRKGGAPDKRRVTLTTPDNVDWYVPVPDETEVFPMEYKSLVAGGKRLIIDKMDISKKNGNKWEGYANNTKYNYGGYRFYIEKKADGYYVAVDMPYADKIYLYKYDSNDGGKWVRTDKTEDDQPITANLTTNWNGQQKKWFIPTPGTEDFYIGFDMATSRPVFAKDMIIVDTDDWTEYLNRTGYDLRYKFYCYKNGGNYDIHVVYPSYWTDGGYDVTVFRYDAGSIGWKQSYTYKTGSGNSNLSDQRGGFFVPGTDSVGFFDGFDAAGPERKQCKAEMEKYRWGNRYNGSDLYYAKKNDKYYIYVKENKVYYEYEWSGSIWQYTTAYAD